MTKRLTPLERGIRIEMREHRLPRRTAEKIARDHLRRNRNYYNRHR